MTELFLYALAAAAGWLAGSAVLWVFWQRQDARDAKAKPAPPRPPDPPAFIPPSAPAPVARRHVDLADADRRKRDGDDGGSAYSGTSDSSYTPSIDFGSSSFDSGSSWSGGGGDFSGGGASGGW